MDILNENLNVILLIFVVILFVFKSKIMTSIYKIKNIDTKELKDQINLGPIQLIDVRSDSEYSSGHIKASKNLPLHNISKTNIHKLDIDLAKPVYIICASGNRSLLASIQLKKLGFPEVYNVSGGMMMWQHFN